MFLSRSCKGFPQSKYINPPLPPSSANHVPAWFHLLVYIKVQLITFLPKVKCRQYQKYFLGLEFQIGINCLGRKKGILNHACCISTCVLELISLRKLFNISGLWLWKRSDTSSMQTHKFNNSLKYQFMQRLYTLLYLQLFSKENVITSNNLLFVITNDLVRKLLSIS